MLLSRDYRDDRTKILCYAMDQDIALEKILKRGKEIPNFFNDIIFDKVDLNFDYGIYLEKKNEFQYVLKEVLNVNNRKEIRKRCLFTYVFQSVPLSSIKSALSSNRYKSRVFTVFSNL